MVSPPAPVQSVQPVPLQPSYREQEVISPTVIQGNVQPQSAPPSVAVPQPAVEKPLAGFAKNIPLSVALRQILPANYSFSLAPDVDTSTAVSWQGGAVWREVLQAMLIGSGLAASEQGNNVNVYRTSGFAMNMLDSAPLVAAPAIAPMPVATQTVMMEPAPESAVGPIVDRWSADAGQTLRAVLEAWCQKAGVQLVWQAEYDYPLQASYATTSTFEDAVRNLLLGFQEAQPQPYASLHNNPSVGQAVLVIEARGNNYSD